MCRVFKANNNSSPSTFKQFETLIKKLGSPDYCVDSVDEELFASCVTPLEENHEELYGIPCFKDLGLDPAKEQGPGVWMGGETEAMRRLKEVPHYRHY